MSLVPTMRAPRIPRPMSLVPTMLAAEDLAAIFVMLANL